MGKLLRNIYRQVFGRRSAQGKDGIVDATRRSLPKRPKIHFDSISVVDKTPNDESIVDKGFIVVMHRNKPLWALFRCPCGCGYVISLSLQSVHKPHWKVSKSSTNRPILYPSVRQNKGCYSHFWIEDGRVHWCDSIVSDPWAAKTVSDCTSLSSVSETEPE